MDDDTTRGEPAHGPDKPPLEPVPSPDGEDGLAPDRAPVARWAMTLVEPLMPTGTRVEADATLIKFIRRNPDWSATWFAGVIHDIVTTLPDDDPWRNLTGAVDLVLLETGQAGGELLIAERFRQDNPTVTGALRADGRMFGTLEDCTDVVMPDLGDPTMDIGLAAVAEPLTPLAASLFAFAAGDLRIATRTFRDVYQALWMGRFSGLADARPADAFFDACAAALRWAMWRRRVYTGAEDTYPSVAAFAWMSKTDRLRAGGLLIDEEGLHESARIDPDAYRGLTDF